MADLLFLEPIFHEKIWGGDRLKTNFNYEIPSDHTGECWAISAHPKGDCLVINGEHKGKPLSQVWLNHRELFGYVSGDVFPLLTKILDASDDLSVQVHPDDAYGLRVEGELGKTECWYILDAEMGAELVLGHHAQSKEEFAQLIEQGRFDELLRKVKVKKNDFFYVPTGTVHALKKGTLVLETQESSDTTYRLYDYDRLDDMGNLRPLHIKQSIDVTNVPHELLQPVAKLKQFEQARVTTYVESHYFTVSKWQVDGELIIVHDKPFSLVSVLDGSGFFNGNEIKKGDHFIVLATCLQLCVTGCIELMVSSL
ncbi:MAG TPA: mannose-6-phosphate isomerase, class I [Firmicutes bacterium]|nr:mannose-6-phosphate isomerase, class I [Bacillota bacterium]